MEKTNALKRVENLKAPNSVNPLYAGITLSLQTLKDLSQFFMDNPSSDNGVVITEISFMVGTEPNADTGGIDYSVEIFPWGTNNGEAKFLQKTDVDDNGVEQIYIGYLNAAGISNQGGGGGDGALSTPPPSS